MVTAILSKPVPDINILRSDIPAGLRDLLSRMLEKDPAKRIASARLVGAELYSLIHGTTSPLHTQTQTQTDVDTGTLHRVMDDLLTLAENCELRMREAEEAINQPQTIDTQSLYYQRGQADAYREVLENLNIILNESQDLIPTDDTNGGNSQPVYAAVERRDVERLFRQAKIKPKNLYEDTDDVFTAVFPKALSVSVQERIRQVQSLAPGIVILEYGQLPDTAEPYVDFAFEHPLN